MTPDENNDDAVLDRQVNEFPPDEFVRVAKAMGRRIVRERPAAPPKPSPEQQKSADAELRRKLGAMSDQELDQFKRVQGWNR